MRNKHQHGSSSCGCGGSCGGCALVASFGAAHFGPTGKSVSDKKWNGGASRFSDEQYRTASAACDPGDGSAKTLCFLPHHEPDGTINRNGVHSAAQRVSSLKGHNTDAVSRAKAHLRSHYSKDLSEDAPDSIAAGMAGEAFDDLVAEAVSAGWLTEPAEGMTAAGVDESHSDDMVALLAAAADLVGEEFAGEYVTLTASAFWGDDEPADPTTPVEPVLEPVTAAVEPTPVVEPEPVIAPVEPLVAAAGDGPMPEERWHAYIFVEGLRTTDHRAVAAGATSWRALPLPLEWARSYEGGHYGKVVVGSIETIEKVEGPAGITLLYAEGAWDLGGDEGLECARQVALQGGTRWVSADVEAIRSHMESSGGGDMDIIDIILGASDDDDWYDCLDEGRVMGATVLSTPAFPQCVIAPASVELDLVEPTVQIPDIVPNLVAAGELQLPALAPAAFFDDPQFTRDDSRMVEVRDRTGRVFRGCPLTVDADGHVFGHIALWGFCHTGFPNECVLAPTSPSGYAYFRTGAYTTAEGDTVPVGQLTVGTKHADGYLRHNEAARHYDTTGWAGADVAAGEDEFGIWVSGFVRADISDEGLRVLRASSPSGDWRVIGGAQEMVAVLEVNVPGFPVPRSLAASLVAAGVSESYDAPLSVYYEHGKVVSLVAAGRMPRNRVSEFMSDVSARLGRIEAVVELLAPLAEERVEKEFASLAERLGID